MVFSNKIGAPGENEAKMFLVKQGYRILVSNYSTKGGEIDIVAEKGGIVSFVEVKTSVFFPKSGFTPEMRVSSGKREKLRRLCEAYLANNQSLQNKEWQIDVISVILNRDGTLREIHHFDNAVFDRKH